MPNEDITDIERPMEGNAAQVDDYKSMVDELFATVDKVSILS